jgi:flagellar biosynthesis protein FlhA
MERPDPARTLVRKRRLGPVLFPLAVVGVVAMLVVPMPTQLLDLLLTMNIAASVLVLLAAMNVTKPLELSSFPSLLLVATLFRLALNVSTSRLILSNGNAGEVVHAFGSFVVGGSLVVGLVVFLMLIVIQFVVITNGATRVAVVGARFTLDAMPGKQMAIDADLAAGIIDEAQAKKRREEIAAEADFYGAMDGSSKFVKGDAVAAVVITLINLVGGFIIGVVQKGMPISEAVSTYSLLTVGDGLVSQIPALLISISSGLIVTRAAGEADLGSDVFDQFRRQHRVMRLGGIVVACFALVPGLPKLTFLFVGGAAFFLGRRLQKADAVLAAETADALALGSGADGDGGPTDENAELTHKMRIEPIGLELAVDLVDLVDPTVGGDLLDRVKALRRKLALEIGVIIPPVRTRDNLDLPQGTYALCLHGVEVARGIAPPGHVLVIADDLSSLPGEAVKEAVFGLPAKWVPSAMRAQAELQGATVVDRAAVITTHLAEVVRTGADTLLGRQEVKRLIELVKETDPAVVDDLTAAQVSTSEIQRLLQEMLLEQVPIRDLVRILEAVSERARHSHDPEGLVEAARRALGPAISASFAEGRHLPVLTLDPLVERTLQDALRPGDHGTWLAIEPELALALSAAVQRQTFAAEQLGHQPVLVCSAPIRPALRRLLAAFPGCPPVLALDELGPQLEIETLGTVNVDQAANV